MDEHVVENGDEDMQVKSYTPVLGGICLATMLIAAGSAKALTIDLTTLGSAGSINDALFIQGNGNSGTGVFPAFVQVTGSGSGDIREAYNTTENNVLNNGASDQFNREILVSQLPIITAADVQYYAFLLDINEDKTDDGRYLSLDSLMLITSATANQSLTDPLTLGTPRYDMGADNHIALDYSLNPGSGQYDMEFLVPVNAFAGSLSTDYVYLYSKFGVLGSNPSGGLPGGDYGTSAGFEEWSLSGRQAGSPSGVPDGGATLALFGLSLLGIGGVRKVLSSRKA